MGADGVEEKKKREGGVKKRGKWPSLSQIDELDRWPSPLPRGIEPRLQELDS